MEYLKCGTQKWTKKEVEKLKSVQSSVTKMINGLERRLFEERS